MEKKIILSNDRESIMIINNKVIVLFFMAVLLFTTNNCLSKKLVLTEVKTQGIVDEQGSAGEQPVDEGPQPVNGRIKEIEVINGEQKYIYVELGYNDKIKSGLKGYIFNDVAMKEKVGKFVFVEVYPNISKGEIIELYYKIMPNAIVYVELDPKKAIK